MQSATRRLTSWLILSSFRTGPRPPALAPITDSVPRPVAGRSFDSTLFSCLVTENRPQGGGCSAAKFDLPPPHSGRRRRKARIHAWAETWAALKTGMRSTLGRVVDRPHSEHEA